MELSGKVNGKLAPGLHRVGGVQGVPKAIYEGFIGKIGICIIVNMFISSEMFIGLT